MKRLLNIWIATCLLLSSLPMVASADAVDAAVTRLNKPYLEAPSSVGPDVFDCSGLVQWSYKQVGVNLGRVTTDQAKEGSRVGRSALQRGDLVFFHTLSASNPDHVGIFIGGNQMIDANSYYGRVSYDNIDDGYWKSLFLYGIRIGVPTSPPVNGLVPLYRYSNYLGHCDRFYTTNFGEVGNGGFNGWVYEGIQCRVFATQQSGTVPFYRYANSSLGLHFYTVQNADLSRFGYHMEGIQCYVYPNNSGQFGPSVMPLYRYSNVWNGSHFYTTK